MAKGSQDKPQDKPVRTQAPEGGISLTGGEWHPWVKDEVVVGRFLRLRDGSKGGSIVDLELEGGKTVTASAPKMLADALDSLKPGTRVSIKFIGTKTSKKTGNDYAVFEAKAFDE